MSYTLRVMTAEDYPAVCKLDADIYRGNSYYTDIDTFDKVSCRNNFGGFMIEQMVGWDATPAGHIYFYDDGFGNRVVASWTVHRACRNQGAGTILMRAAIDSFPGTHTNNGGVYVHIRVSNKIAKQLLFSMGFNVTDHIIHRAYSLPENPIEEDGILAHIGDMIWVHPDDEPEVIGEPQKIARREF